jgi:hypothetical protein
VVIKVLHTHFITLPFGLVVVELGRENVDEVGVGSIVTGTFNEIREVEVEAVAEGIDDSAAFAASVPKITSDINTNDTIDFLYFRGFLRIY